MKRIAVAILLGLTAAACAQGGPPQPLPGPIGPAVFRAADFAWSTQPGSGGIDGRVAYRQDERAYTCAGSVGLTPETAWTRQRFATLYGSTDRAALPAAVVRQRSVSEASADYRGFVRNQTCDANGFFRFTGLPDGSWFVIVPATPQGGGDPVVLMRRVVTSGGRMSAVVLQ